jgi:hypothetical protein
MDKRTPTPWQIYDDSDPHHVKIKGIRPDIGGAHTADVLFQSNAAFIVKAVNSHDELKASLAEMVGIYWGDGDGIEPPPACIIRATKILNEVQ